MLTPAQREYQRTWYAANRERKLVEKRTRAQRFKQQLNEIKAAHGCRDCSERDFRCLDFHHREPAEKRYNISQDARNLSWEKVLEEVEKCVVLCSNCHRKHHYIG